ncbi:hypothetical protein [Paenibacillus lautus]|uniref:hypothetical protein n=1 Tax=Paenibacillus lautus TaxID=1401 RepID=UPI003D282F9C
MILPIAEPFINGYPKHAIQLSILCQYNESLPWILSNYIQLKCSKDFLDLSKKSTDWFDFHFVDPKYVDSLMYIEKLSRDTVDKLKIGILDLLITSINSGLYIYTSVDEYYLPSTNAYKKRSKPHSILIYGYDSNNKILNIGGFSKGATQVNKFRTYTVTYDEFLKAYNSLNYIDNYDHYLNRIYLMKYNTSRIFDFDIVLVKELLGDYLHSKNSSERLRAFNNPSKNYNFGISVYENLISFYKRLENNNNYFDIRPLHILWEHKKCMVERVTYMANHKYISNSSLLISDLIEIEKFCLNCRNLLLKYRVTKNSEIVSRLLAMLDFILVKEQKILYALYKELDLHY